MSSLGDLAPSIHSRSLHSHFHGLTAIAQPDSSFSSEPTTHGLWTDAHFYRQALQSLSSEVTLSEVVKVKVSWFYGHVYNLHTKSEIYTANGFIVHNCRPKNNWLEGSPYEYAALRHCRPNLDQAIADYRPRCIVSLGGVALRELTGEAGEARGVTHLAGYVMPLASGISHNYICGMCEGKDKQCDHCMGTGWVSRAATTGQIPTIANFHPSYLRRGKASHQGVFSRIIQRGLAIAAGRDRNYMWGVDPDDPVTWQQPSYTSPAITREVSEDCPCIINKLRRMGYSGGQGEHPPQVPPDKNCPICHGSGEINARTEIVQNAVDVSGGRLQYWTHPTLDQCRSVLNYLRGNSGLWLAKDIETSESSSLDEDAREGFSDTEVRLFQLSYQPGTGIAIPYTGEFKAIVREMLHLRNPFYGHNWDNFDHKVLRAAAAREGWTYAPSQRCYDTLDMFHHWQPDLPAHLQFAASFINFPFPWKHLASTNIEFYGICDVDADLRLGLFLEATLKRDNLWGEGEAYSLTLGYTGQEREVRPVLAAMEDRGVPIDDAARLRLGAEFEAAQRELGKELAERAPVECQRVHPKEGYAGMPPQVKQWFIDHGTEPKHWVEHPIDELKELHEVRFQDKPTTAKDGTIEEGEWYTYQRRDFQVAGIATDGEPNITIATRWCRVYDFNPNSSQQLIAYMKAKGHRVPKSKIEDEDGNQKDTTAAKELQRLAVKTADDFYLKVIEYRGLTKLQGTYVDGFRPHADGRVHTTFTFQTAIAQLSARAPNTTNFPKLKPTPALAKAIRGMICADEGCILTEVDFKSCHVITLGLLAGDDNYTRLGRLDIHSAVAGHFLQLWDVREILKESDEQLLARFKWLKSDPERKRIRDDQAKHAILGIGNGLKAKGLYERYMEQFPPRQCPECKGTTKVPGMRGLKLCPMCGNNLVRGMQTGMQVAADVLSVCEMLFDKVFKYQDEQVMEAHYKQKLGTPFGHLRRFYEAKVWNNKMKGGPGWDHGDQSEEAIAYRLANTAHAHMREVMKELYRRGLDEKFGLFNMVHDSLMLHHREELAEDTIREVVPVMMAPSRVMPGLWLGVEASQGRRWNSMREVTLPSTLTPLATIAAGDRATQEVTA